MRVRPARARREEHQGAATGARLALERLDQRTADAFAAVGLVNDERADLRRRPVVLDRGGDLEMSKADDLVAGLGDDHPVTDDLEAFEAGGDRVGLRRIAELTQKVGDSPRVGGSRVPDRQPHDGRVWAVLGEVLTAIVTPFRDDESVDYDRFRELALYLVEHGSDGLVVAGTTGESPTLTDDERLELFRVAVDAVGGRATVVAGTGTYSTAHSVHLTEQGHAIGVDGFLVVTPYYNKPPQRGIVEHFKAIAASSDKPIVVYNIPTRVVINIEPETMIQLAQIPTVQAVKQANDDLAQARRILEETDLDLYAGDDNLLLRFLELGGIGVISVHAHIVGLQLKAMIRAYRDGHMGTAQQIEDELAPSYELLQVQTNPIAIKVALNLLGQDVGGLRLPLVEADEGEIARVRDCLERLGILSPAAV
jgi:4-hydroxy-tetrahydrodipicolinate synthase